MGNLFSITTNQAAITGLFRVVNRYVGNLAPMPGVFPEVTALTCPHGGRYSNGPSRRRRDRGREGWGLWMTGRGPGTQPGDPTPGTKSGAIVPKHSVPRYSVPRYSDLI